MKVCEKVQKKGVTSYNEVADELVNEFSDPRNMSAADQVRDIVSLYIHNKDLGEFMCYHPCHQLHLM